MLRFFDVFYKRYKRNIHPAQNFSEVMLLLAYFAVMLFSGSSAWAQDPSNPAVDDRHRINYFNRLLTFPVCSNTVQADTLYPSYYNLPNPQDRKLSQLNAYLSCLWRSRGSTLHPGAIFYSRECSDAYGCVAIREYSVKNGVGSEFPDDRPLTFREYRNSDGTVHASDLPFMPIAASVDGRRLCGVIVYQLNLARSRHGLPNLCESVPEDPIDLFCHFRFPDNKVVHPCDKNKSLVKNYYTQTILEFGKYILINGLPH